MEVVESSIVPGLWVLREKIFPCAVDEEDKGKEGKADGVAAARIEEKKPFKRGAFKDRPRKKPKTDDGTPIGSSGSSGRASSSAPIGLDAAAEMEEARRSDLKLGAGRVAKRKSWGVDSVSPAFYLMTCESMLTTFRVSPFVSPPEPRAPKKTATGTTLPSPVVDSLLSPAETARRSPNPRPSRPNLTLKLKPLSSNLFPPHSSSMPCRLSARCRSRSRWSTKRRATRTAISAGDTSRVTSGRRARRAKRHIARCVSLNGSSPFPLRFVSLFLPTIGS
jgi:hypothetical protein